MNLRGDWRDVVEHIEATDRGGQVMDPKKIAVRALVTFGQVFLSVLLGTGVLDVSAGTAQTALMAAAGAGLSVLYNAATQWLDANP